MPNCELEYCYRPQYAGANHCIFHIPKLASEAPLSPLVVDFERALFAYIDAESASGSASSLYFDKFIFPPFACQRYCFKRPVIFDNVEAVGDLSFSECIFSAGVAAHRLKCAGALYMGRVESRGPLYFDRAEIRGNANFESCNFSQDVRFNDCEFCGDASFAATIFDKRATFLENNFRGDTSFAHCEFMEEARFVGEKGVFAGPVWFRFVKAPAGVVFEHLDLSSFSFRATNVEQIKFMNVKWLEYGGRRALFDERRARERHHKYDASARRWTFEGLAENYRQLVLIHEKTRDFASAEDFHVGEMETLRLRQRWPLNLYFAYRAVSLYGASYARAAVVLLLLIGIAAFAFMFTGLREIANHAHVIKYTLTAERTAWPPLGVLMRDFRCAILLVISVFSRERFYEPVGWISQVLTVVSGLAITAQAALLLLAVRRRFKR